MNVRLQVFRTITFDTLQNFKVYESSHFEMSNKFWANSGQFATFLMIALVFKFEMQINDSTQYRGKKAPHGKKGDGIEPVSHHKKQQCQNAKDIDNLVTRKEGSNTCCCKIEFQYRVLFNIG